MVFPQPWNSGEAALEQWLAERPEILPEARAARYVLGQLVGLDLTLKREGLAVGRDMVSTALSGEPDFDGFGDSCDSRASFLRNLYRGAPKADEHAAEQEARALDSMAAAARGHSKSHGYS